MTGRSRLCKVCGDWHSLERPWPHNCRSEAPPRNWRLAAPMVAPPFAPFVADPVAGIYVDDRRQRRDFMERRDLVDYDAGVKPEREPTQAEWTAQFAADLERAEQEYHYRPPVEKMGQTDLGGAAEISTDNIEVFK